MKRGRHPVEKAVSIFPAIPNRNSEACEGSENVKLCNRRPRYPSFGVVGRQTSISEKFTPPPMHINGVRFDDRKNKYGSHHRDNLDNIRATTKRLNDTAANFSSMLQVKSTSKGGEDLVLPSIVQVANQDIPARPFKAEEQRSYKTFLLPMISRESCRCTKTKPKKTTFDRLKDIKQTRLTKQLRPDDTPPMLSVQVRWKNNRNGTSDYGYDALWEVFSNFGEIDKLLLKSMNSAIVVFTSVEDACSAARIMHKLGKEMKLHTRWMNDHDDKEINKYSKFMMK